MKNALDGLHGSLLCGVSGGADSMALLSLLIGLRDAGQITLAACHVNHGLRGAESDRDEMFVRNYCETHGVPLYAFRLTPPVNPGEDWARNARYAAFRKAMDRTHADALVLAHHRDDQAETVLEHLLRGSGLDGLCGMRGESERLGMRILRPLLGTSREALTEYLRREGIPWREDATNAQDDYLRNRVRHALLPLMERFSRNAAEHIAETAALLNDDAEALNVQAGAWIDFHPDEFLPVDELTQMPRAIRSRAVRMWVARETGRTIGLERTKALLSLPDMPVGSAESLPGGWRCCRGTRFLHLTDGEKAALPEYSVTGMGEYPMGGVTVTVGGSRGHFGNGCTVQELPAALLEGAVIRTRREGDWIRPFGMTGRQSLQDYFVNRRIDGPFRDRVPLLCRGSEVLFAGGVGAGGIPRWSAGAENIRIAFTGSIPWNVASAQEGNPQPENAFPQHI